MQYPRVESWYLFIEFKLKLLELNLVITDMSGHFRAQLEYGLDTATSASCGILYPVRKPCDRRSTRPLQEKQEPGNPRLGA